MAISMGDPLSRFDFPEIQSFETEHEEWMEGLEAWVDEIEDASLHEVEISLGIWHLHQPTENDGVVGHALAKVARHLKQANIKCNVTMRIAIPSAPNTPCVADLQLPITDIEQAEEILKHLFGAKYRHLDWLWSERKIPSTSFRILKRDMLQCQQRLDRFMQIIAGPPPRWARQESRQVAVLLDKTILDSASAMEKEVLRRDSSEGGDVASLEDDMESGTYIGRRARILKAKKIILAAMKKTKVVKPRAEGTKIAAPISGSLLARGECPTCGSIIGC